MFDGPEKLITGAVLSILTAIVFTGVGIYAETMIRADKITYTDSNGNEITLDYALDTLYTNQSTVIDALRKQNKIIFMSSSQKKATGWNDLGFYSSLYADKDYLQFNSNRVTIKKTGRIKVTVLMHNTGATTSAPQYQLIKNGSVVMTVSNTTAANDLKMQSVTIDMSIGDTIYAQMNGGANNPTYYVTYFETVN